MGFSHDSNVKGIIDNAYMKIYPIKRYSLHLAVLSLVFPSSYTGFNLSI